LEVTTFRIQAHVLADTLHFLKEVGEAGYEGFVLWGAQKREPSTLLITSAVIPDQHAIVTEQGLLVMVDGQALFEVNRELHERNEILAGQVHTHPTTAYHSSTDDHLPLVTLLGAISLVLPDFARYAPDDRATWAWYRLADYGIWQPATDTTVIFE
jgi:hypothetical protein